MVNYENGKIYKIVSDANNLVYVGSTTNKYLSQRLGEHQSGYNRYKQGKFKSNLTSFKLIECPDRRIELIEKFPCESKDELTARERYWIENTECVNKRIDGRTKKEWTEDNKEKLKIQKKEYAETHKEEIKVYKSTEEYKAKKKEWDKNYREGEKREELLEKKRQYNRDNAEKIAQQRKAYREANKEKIAEQKRQSYLRKKNISI